MCTHVLVNQRKGKDFKKEVREKIEQQDAYGMKVDKYERGRAKRTKYSWKCQNGTHYSIASYKSNENGKMKKMDTLSQEKWKVNVIIQMWISLI